MDYFRLKAHSSQRMNRNQREVVARGRRTVILGALAVTVLNPHLYLDTVVILGSIGGQFEGHDRIAFALGTIMASFVWFYTLSMGAAKLGPTLSKPNVKRHRYRRCTDDVHYCLCTRERAHH